MVEELVRISTNISDSQIFLGGILNLPENSKGMVIFAHGSGSGKHSSRNQLVAEKLIENNFGTFLFDLLSKKGQESDKRLEKISTKIPGIEG